MNSFCASQRGLSLIELLVVLVIVALVSSLLMQGLGFGLSLYERVHSRAEVMRQQVLFRQWFRQVNETLVAKPSSSGVSLEGDSNTFFSTTLNPLLGESGRSQDIRWRIEGDIVWYEESGVSLFMTSVPGGAAFAYLHQSGRWSNHWPPKETSESLPDAIALARGDERNLIAALRVRDIPDLLLEDSRRERE